MKPPTTGERIVWGHYACDDAECLATYRSSNVYMRVIERQTAATIDAALAAKDAERDAAIAAERERIAAFCEANPNKYGDQLAAAIRARKDQ